MTIVLSITPSGRPQIVAAGHDRQRVIDEAACTTARDKYVVTLDLADGEDIIINHEYQPDPEHPCLHCGNSCPGNGAPGTFNCVLTSDR